MSYNDRKIDLLGPDVLRSLERVHINNLHGSPSSYLAARRRRENQDGSYLAASPLEMQARALSLSNQAFSRKREMEQQDAYRKKLRERDALIQIEHEKTLAHQARMQAIIKARDEQRQQQQQQNV